MGVDYSPVTTSIKLVNVSDLVPRITLIRNTNSGSIIFDDVLA